MMARGSLYAIGVDGVMYNRRLFWVTMVDTAWQACCLYFLPMWAYEHTGIGLYELGYVMVTSIVRHLPLHSLFALALFDVDCA